MCYLAIWILLVTRISNINIKFQERSNLNSDLIIYFWFSSHVLIQISIEIGNRNCLKRWKEETSSHVQKALLCC